MLMLMVGCGAGVSRVLACVAEEAQISEDEAVRLACIINVNRCVSRAAPLLWPPHVRPLELRRLTICGCDVAATARTCAARSTPRRGLASSRYWPSSTTRAAPTPPLSSSRAPCGYDAAQTNSISRRAASHMKTSLRGWEPTQGQI